jgi:hypothetical protein
MPATQQQQQAVRLRSRHTLWRVNEKQPTSQALMYELSSNDRDQRPAIKQSLIEKGNATPFAAPDRRVV